jgi:CCR4-NOT transcription complex subunit 4
MVASSIAAEKECPLCITPFNEAEYEFYPCPCGYQICCFCLSKIREQTPSLCPSCRRPFDTDVAKRIGVQYRPQRSGPSPSVPQDLYVSQRIAQIVGIPDHLQTLETLTKPQFLGQYGYITKMAFGEASNGPALRAVLPIPGSVFVQFTTPAEARSCILSIDGHHLGPSVIEAALAIVQICPRAARDNNCNLANCMKRHRSPRDQDFVVKIADLDSSQRIENYPTVVRPPNYDLYPKRSGCVPVFPAPRLISTGNFPWATMRIYSTKPLQLNDFALLPGPSLPAAPPTFLAGHCSSLAAILGLE